MTTNQPTSALGKAKFFLHRGLWETRPETLPWIRRCTIQLLRLGILVSSGFRRCQCALHAASLTFFSLMALIPVLAMTLALARAFGGADLAKEQINKQLDNWMVQMEQAAEAKAPASAEEQPSDNVTKAFASQVREIADKLFTQIDQLGFGTLGGIGAVMLLWTVIGVLGKVEASFNQVWGIEQPRTLVRKFADYLAVIMLLPFLITAASTVPVAAMAVRIMHKTVGADASNALGTLLGSGLFKTSVTLLTGTLTFAFFLGFMPNTRVKLVPALTGGFITVVLFAAWLKLCAMLQIGIAKYSALYGGFAVLPILLLWVHTSWQIILLGAEIAFAVQNRDTYMLEENAAQASARARLLLALTLCAAAARQARQKDGGPFAAEAFARQHGISYRFVRDILEDLVRNNLLAEVAGHTGEYLLCRCGESLTVAEITKVMLDDGEPPESLGLGNLDDTLQAFSLRLNDTLDAAFATPVSAV